MRPLKNIFICLGTILLFSCEKDNADIAADENYDFVKSCSSVLFISNRDENSTWWYLYRMSADGTGIEKLSDLPVGCRRPVKSNSGNIILFVHQDNELYSMKTDGANLKLLDNSEGQIGSIAWSYDDRKIIYFKSGNIVLYDVKSDSKKTLTHNGNYSCGTFTLNDKILFTERGDFLSSSIYLMNMDGKGKKLLIEDGCCPVISPDGKTIAYISTKVNGSQQIFTADITGEGIEQLTSSVSPRIYPGWPPSGNHSPVWTPDGKKIVYVSWENELPDIYIMERDGTNKKRLTDSGKRDEDPVITKDGRFILFTSKRNDYVGNVFYMTINGNNQTSLTDFPMDDIFPVVVP
jgi:Tol biopolymer transport system component